MIDDDEATVRTARAEDYDPVCGLMDGLDELHRERLPWLFKAPGVPARPRAFFAGMLDRDDAAVFVAEAGSIVGVVFGLIRTAPEFPVFVRQRWGVIDNLVVDPAWRRRGVGRRLAHAVENWARGLGAPWIELNVYEFNADARRFYEALGYLPMATRLRKPFADDSSTSG